MRGGEGRL
jgi:hypothetical protein